MYARKYQLADFIEPCDALDRGRKLLPDSDSDDDIRSSTNLPLVGTGRPPLMNPVDLSFVGSVGAVLSK